MRVNTKEFLRVFSLVKAISNTFQINAFNKTVTAYLGDVIITTPIETEEQPGSVVFPVSSIKVSALKKTESLTIEDDGDTWTIYDENDNILLSGAHADPPSQIPNPASLTKIGTVSSDEIKVLAIKAKSKLPIFLYGQKGTVLSMILDSHRYIVSSSKIKTKLSRNFEAVITKDVFASMMKIFSHLDGMWDITGFVQWDTRFFKFSNENISVIIPLLSKKAPAVNLAVRLPHISYSGEGGKFVEAVNSALSSVSTKASSEDRIFMSLPGSEFECGVAGLEEISNEKRMIFYAKTLDELASTVGESVAIAYNDDYTYFVSDNRIFVTGKINK